MSSASPQYKAPNIWPSLGTFLGSVLCGILAVILLVLNGFDFTNLRLESLAQQFLAGALLGAVLVVLALAALVVSVVFQLIFLYKSWALIRSTARTTPGKAVGFLFIPFFNFYWFFQAIYGWAKDYNKLAAQKGLSPVSAGIFLTYSILIIIDWVFSRFDGGFGFSSLVDIAMAVLLLIMGIQMQNRLSALVEMLNAEANPSATESVE